MARALVAVALGAALTAGAAATPTPTPTPSATSTAGTVAVSNSRQLVAALKAAKPGQTIALADGLYTGKFVAAASGTDDDPITLTGTRAAVLSTGSVASGYGLHITGDRWRVSGLSVTKSGKGIVLDGSTHTVISGVDVGNIGAEGVHFRASSSDGVVEDSVIHDTGVRRPGYGEGIYVGSSYKNWSKVMGSGAKADRSDRVRISGNLISTTAAEGIDLKEGTKDGVVVDNRFQNAGYSGDNSADSWIDVKGNGYEVTGNSGSQALLDAIQVHTVRKGWGQGNSFAENVVLGEVAGYAVWIQPTSKKNTVTCEPSDAAKGLTNGDCAE